MTSATTSPAGPAGPPAPPRISFDSVSRVFGATTALSQVSFAMAPGEIVGLLGHNGAGKTTLINIASGALAAGSGTVAIDGEVLNGLGPARIAERGLCVVSQVPSLIPGISVWDNLFLADTRRQSHHERVEAARSAMAEVGLGDISLHTQVSLLSVGERQLVSLARGLVRGDIRVLLLDEPTAALGLPETRTLHGLVRRFAASGTSVIYVSHRLPDVMDICTRAVIFNSGAVVTDRPMSELSLAELASALAPGYTDLEPAAVTPGEVVLRTHDPDPAGLQLEFRAGEVVGMFGMAAGIEFDILTALFGLGTNRKTDDLTFELFGHPFAASGPSEAIRAGIHLVPADRETDGLAHNLSARENVMLPWYHSVNPGGILRAATGSEIYAQARSLLNVQGPSGDQSIDTFSGGNRQKHLLARWMLPHRPQLLLLLQPTQGVDIRGKNDIVRAVQSFAAEGCCVIVASSESDEIARMCNRSYVIYGHRATHVEAGAEMEGDLLSGLLALSGDSLFQTGRDS